MSKIKLENLISNNDKRKINNELTQIVFLKDNQKDYAHLITKFSDKYNIGKYEVETLIQHYELPMLLKKQAGVKYN